MKFQRYYDVLVRGAAVLACAVIFMAAHVSAAPNVERVSFSERSDGGGYVVRFHVDGPVAAYSEPRRLAGGRLEIILFNTRLAPEYQADEVVGPISNYVEEAASGHLIFRFRMDATVAVQASAYRDRESNDVLMGITVASPSHASRLEVPKQLPVPVRLASAPGGSSSSASTAERTRGSEFVREAALADDIPGADALGEDVGVVDATGSGAGSRAVVGGTQWMLNTVVIDAGHGGKDPGALANGVREKDITLGVALKLGAYLEDLLGVNVEYTRDDDRFIELRDRGRIANEHDGKLFISLHANAAGSAAARGAETYFLGMHKSDAARTTMERENSVVRFESSQDEYENMTEEALIRMELTQSAYMRKSEQLSELIQEQFETRVHRRNRGVKQAGFYVLWGASMPAVLVELGFLTNPTEAAFLRSEQGQDYMASAIYRAVRAYKQQYEKGLGRPRAD
ncbi:MAG: N-acetylmuramoyl-L-alanine amidase [Rhodothermales bacterium]